MTREDALKIVRENYPHFGTTEPWLDLEKALATLVPELRESEDERIKKRLITLIRVLDSSFFTGNNPSKEQCLAYLEKQKEQKPVPKFSVGDYVIDTNYKGEPLYQIVGIDKECYICEYRGDKEMGDRTVMHFAFNNPYLRLEQKPEDRFEEAREKYQVEWGEEDEMIRNAILGFLSPDKGGTKYSSNAELVEWSNWLKSLRPQPKVELSEDVKKTLDEVSHILIGLNYKQVAKDYKQAVEKLISLSEEPVQKFNTDKLQEIAKPAAPHKKPTPEDRAKFMEKLHEYAESKKPDKSLEVDLEKDVESWFFNEISSKINVEHTMYHYFQECARRYFELGKNRLK